MAFPWSATTTLTSLSQQLQAGDTTSEALTAAYLERIKASKLNAFITVTADEALAKAQVADQQRRAGDTRPLLGIPIAHKDLFCTQGVLTTCGSKMLANFVAPYNATVVSRCHKAGLVSLGKTNMDEFAMGCSNETSFFGPVNNPWQFEHTPGGSSGGSAAAVAGGLAPVATASDTGGSIRLPAAFCGLTGCKPTYGRISRYGMIAFASSLDQAGVIARHTEDVALMLNCLVGFDQHDSTSSDVSWQEQTLDNLKQSCQGLRIGIPRVLLEELEADCQHSFEAGLEALKELGMTLTDIDLTYARYGVSAYHVLASAEASSNLSRYDGIRYGHRCEQPNNLQDLYIRSRTEGFGFEVKRRILIGTYALSAGYQDAYYLKAQSIRRLIRDDFQSAFQDVDLIATPTSIGPPFRQQEKLQDPVTMYQQDAFTALANLAGLPCISLPAPMVQNLPYGLHLQASPFAEDVLLRTGYALQQISDWHLQTPSGMTI